MEEVPGKALILGHAIAASGTLRRQAQGPGRRAEHVEKAKKTTLELLALKNEFRAAREGNPEVRTVPPSEGEEAQTTGAPPDFAIAGRTYRW